MTTLGGGWSWNMESKIAEILNEECQGVPELQSFTSKPDEVTIEEDPLFLDGYSSVIVRLRAGDASTVIAKHAPPYVRKFGEAIPMSQTRIEVEMKALELFEENIPGSSPKPYFYSTRHNIILMEELVNYKTLQSQLLVGNINTASIETVAIHLAGLHRATHKDNISAQKWAELHELLHKHLLPVEQLVQLWMSFSYIKNPVDEVTRKLKEIADDRVFNNTQMNGLLLQVMGDFVYGKECLIHGDSNPKNVLVKGNDSKLIDLEFARLGQCRVDVGRTFADMVMIYFYHLLSPEDGHREIAGRVKEGSCVLVITYMEHMFGDLGEKQNRVSKFLKDLAAFTGCLIFTRICFGGRRYLGVSQIKILEASIRLMEQYDTVENVDKIFTVLAVTEPQRAVGE